MYKSIAMTCPACKSDLVVTKLSCKNCDTEIVGNFELNPFQNLSAEDWNFVEQFLLCEGNYSKLQSIAGGTYATVKARLNYILNALGLKSQETQITDDTLSISQPKAGDSKVVKTIKEKLAKYGGKASMPMLKGEDIAIWLASDGSGVIAAGLKNVILKWEHFDAIVEKASALGGKMFRGDSAAQNGKRIGSEDLPLDTIDAFISTEFYGAVEGETTLRRSTYYAGILAWAGVVNNQRSDGEGGFIVIIPSFRI